MGPEAHNLWARDFLRATALLWISSSPFCSNSCPFQHFHLHSRLHLRSESGVCLLFLAPKRCLLITYVPHLNTHTHTHTRTHTHAQILGGSVQSSPPSRPPCCPHHSQTSLTYLSVSFLAFCPYTRWPQNSCEWVIQQLGLLSFLTSLLPVTHFSPTLLQLPSSMVVIFTLSSPTTVSPSRNLGLKYSFWWQLLTLPAQPHLCSGSNNSVISSRLLDGWPLHPSPPIIPQVLMTLLVCLSLNSCFVIIITLSIKCLHFLCHLCLFLSKNKDKPWIWLNLTLYLLQVARAKTGSWDNWSNFSAHRRNTLKLALSVAWQSYHTLQVNSLAYASKWLSCSFSPLLKSPTILYPQNIPTHTHIQ